MAKYDRFWELHITGTNGFYDFAPSVLDQRNYQRTTHDAQLPADKMLVTPRLSTAPGIINRVPIGVDGLPAQGYVASCLTVIDMATPTITDDDKAIVAWINDPGHIGKLRVNAHGNGMGQIGMADGAGALYKVFYQDADRLVAWLVANGLAPIESPREASVAGKKNSRGLVTFNLAVCMGARYDTSPATLNWSQTSSNPADGSAAGKIATALSKAKLKGIEVTASNEITMDGASGVPGQWGRTFGLGGGQAPCTYYASGNLIAWNIVKTASQGVQIVVPDGWNVSPNWTSPGGTIAPSTDFDTWTPQGGTPSGGWHITNAQGDRVEVPAGWLVDGRARQIRAPLGFSLTSKGKYKGGSLASIPDAPFTGMGQRLAHSSAKARVIS